MPHVEQIPDHNLGAWLQRLVQDHFHRDPAGQEIVQPDVLEPFHFMFKETGCFKPRITLKFVVLVEWRNEFDKGLSINTTFL